MSVIFVKHFELPCVERCYINILALPCLGPQKSWLANCASGGMTGESTGDSTRFMRHYLRILFLLFTPFPWSSQKLTERGQGSLATSQDTIFGHIFSFSCIFSWMNLKSFFNFLVCFTQFWPPRCLEDRTERWQTLWPPHKSLLFDPFFALPRFYYSLLLWP